MLYHLADVDLYVGVVPLAAAIVLFLSRASGDDGRLIRRFAVVTSMTVASLLAVTALYLTTLPGSQPGAQETRVYDRYVFYLVPLILVAFFGWIERGGPRPRKLAVAAAVVTAVLPLTLPYSDLLTPGEWGVSSSNVALVPWAIVKLVADVSVVPLVFLYACACAYAFVRVSPSRVPRLVRLVVLNLAVLGMAVHVGNSAVAANAARYGRAPNADWIDRAVGPGGQVIAIWSGRSNWQRWYGIWENQILNRKVRAVYHLGAEMPYDAPGTGLRLRDGELILHGKRLHASYVLTDRRLPIDGRRIAADARTQMVLYRVGGPVTLR
jgi:hypothetical protein